MKRVDSLRFGLRAGGTVALLLLAVSAAQATPVTPGGVPPIDEFSGFMADLADDGHLGETPSTATGDESAAILKALDRVFAERMAILERAEALLRQAAQEEHVSPEEVRIAVEQALELKQAAFEAALAAVKDIEIPVDMRRAVYAMAAEIEARSARITDAVERLECALGHPQDHTEEKSR